MRKTFLYAASGVLALVAANAFAGLEMAETGHIARVEADLAQCRIDLATALDAQASCRFEINTTNGLAIAAGHHLKRCQSRQATIIQTGLW